MTINPAQTSAPTGANALNMDVAQYDQPRRLGTETKAAFRTTELIAYVTAVLLVAITAIVVGNGDTGGSSSDPFSANDALRYITYLTIGYMIARGLAKSGSREVRDV